MLDSPPLRSAPGVRVRGGKGRLAPPCWGQCATARVAASRLCRPHDIGARRIHSLSSCAETVDWRLAWLVSAGGVQGVSHPDLWGRVLLIGRGRVEDSIETGRVKLQHLGG